MRPIQANRFPGFVARRSSLCEISRRIEISMLFHILKQCSLPTIQYNSQFFEGIENILF
jgi:hypothetical protein